MDAQRHIAFFQQAINVRYKPGLMMKLERAGIPLGMTDKNVSSFGTSHRKNGGNWKRTIPKRVPKPETTLTKYSSASDGTLSRCRCVICCEALTLKRKASGVADLQLSIVA